MSTLSHSRHSRGCYEQERCNQKPAIWLRAHVRFGSKADMCAAISHVTLPPIATAKADMGRKLMAAKYQPRKQTGAYQIPNGSAVAAAYDQNAHGRSIWERHGGRSVPCWAGSGF